MKLTRHHESITLYVTPNLLRVWADLCERKWKQSIMGESVVFHEIDDGDVLLRLAFDQDKLYCEKI